MTLEEASSYLREMCTTQSNCAEYDAIHLAIDALEKQIEETKTKHGKWIIVEYEYFTCSVCGESYFNNMDSHKMAKDYLKNGGAYKYCPWCGAKMDGKDAEND